MHTGLFAAAFSEAWEAVLAAVVGIAIGVFQRPARKLADRWFAVRRRVAAVERAEESAAGPSVVVGPIELSLSTDATLGNLARDRIKGPRIYVSEIAATSFRCFEQVAVPLNHPGGPSALRHKNVNLILGDNGTGKSTLLKAIALAALGPILNSSGFVPYHLIRNRAEQAHLGGAFVIDEPDGEPTRLMGAVDIARRGDYERLDPRHDQDAWSEIFDESNLSFLVLGYGVARRVADDENDRALLERSRRRRRYERVASLFDESAVLTPLSSWLPGLNYERRAEVEDILTQVLPDAELDQDAAEETFFRTRGQRIPYRALSDGYKSFIGWIGDLLFQIDSASEGKLPFQEVGGIVLVDEVDLLLHPAWQRQVVPSIARALPKLQFVFTTHSPIVAGTLEAGNILLAHSTAESGSTVERIDAEIHGLNAEQILLSSYFGLESTRSGDAQQTLSTLAQRAMDGDDEAAVDYLRALAGERPDLG